MIAKCMNYPFDVHELHQALIKLSLYATTFFHEPCLSTHVFVDCTMDVDKRLYLSEADMNLKGEIPDRK